MTRMSVESIIADLPSLRALHSPGSREYIKLKEVARRHLESIFGSKAVQGPQPLPPFGSIIFPYRRMGMIDSLDLFGLDELIIFSFYWANRGLYRRAIDIGANIGLHSLVMARCGFSVTCFEPDPQTFAALKINLEANQCTSVEAVNKAVSRAPGSAEFIRVLGNTTGSHLAGAKKNPYGELQRFKVELEGMPALRGRADLFKIDAEGHEFEILKTTDADFWTASDALVEVGSPENARALFEHFDGIGVRLFSQKKNWEQVRGLEDMPTSYREGTLFVSRKREMPWS